MGDAVTRAGVHTAILNGHELWYLDSGDGPAILFIHGLTGSHRNWEHLVQKLNTDHRVLTPDGCCR
jgi:pimeloyl-ACP methyl ester carboxylesterase